METHHHNPSTTDSTELFVSPKSDSSFRVIPLLETEPTFGRHDQLGETKPCLNFQRHNVDDW